jgi:hypothetical protein
MNAFLENTRAEFQRLQGLAQGALAQVSDPDFFRSPNPESNSLAILCQHLSGNMLSRWTNFLTEDGEKPDRHRDAEFETPPGADRSQIMERWKAGWECLYGGLAALSPEDLDRTVHIRSQPLSALQAIHRQLTHCAYHVGQIVYLCRHWKGTGWSSLSVPRGRSDEFLAEMRAKFGKA